MDLLTEVWRLRLRSGDSGYGLAISRPKSGDSGYGLATPATGWRLRLRAGDSGYGLARFVGSICLDLGFAGYVHCPSYVARLNQNEPQSR